MIVESFVSRHYFVHSHLSTPRIDDYRPSFLIGRAVGAIGIMTGDGVALSVGVGGRGAYVGGVAEPSSSGDVPIATVVVPAEVVIAPLPVVDGGEQTPWSLRASQTRRNRNPWSMRE